MFRRRPSLPRPLPRRRRPVAVHFHSRAWKHIFLNSRPLHDFHPAAREQITRRKLTVAAVGSAPMKSRGFNFFPSTSFLFDLPFPTSDSSAFYILSCRTPVTQYTRTADREISHSRQAPLAPSRRRFILFVLFIFLGRHAPPRPAADLLRPPPLRAAVGLFRFIFMRVSLRGIITFSSDAVNDL